MQIPHQIPHAQFGKGLTMYNNHNEGHNNIGNGGLLHLSKATWGKLGYLLLSHKREKGDWMRVEGFYYIMRGNWRILG
jgi:hypothetical protein